MAKAFADYSASELVAAIKVSLVDYFRTLGHSSEVEFDERPDLMRFSCAIPMPFLNGVFRTKLPPGRVDAAVEETIAYFRSREVPAFLWWLMPDMQPADLGEVLKGSGFAFGEGPTGMAVDLENVNHELVSPAGLSIQVVDDEGTRDGGLPLRPVALDSRILKVISLTGGWIWGSTCPYTTISACWMESPWRPRLCSWEPG